MSESPSLTLNAAQGAFITLPTKYRAYVAGFGGGKTFIGCVDSCLFAGQHPKLVQGYFGPTYPSIRDVYYPTITEAAERLGFRAKVTTGNREVDLFRGRSWYGKIICRSMDNPGAIVGFKIARGHVDELDTLSRDKAKLAWNKIIARLRLVVPGVVNGLGVTTTPEGFRFVYDRFAAQKHHDYSMVQASTYENGLHLPPDYIQSLKDTYPEELIAAYLNGDFVNLTAGTVYRSFNRRTNDSKETIKPKEALKVGMDFNIGQMAARVFVVRDDGWHCVAEISRGIDTPAMIDTLKDRYRDHHLTIYPDATGRNRSSKGASLSDIGMLRQAGFTVLAKDINPRVRDRVLSANKGFEKRALWVNVTACPQTVKDLEQQAYDDNGEPDKDGGNDHGNDAFGYPIAYEFPVVRPIAQHQELRL